MLGLEHVVLRICAAMFGTSGHSQRPTGLVTDLYLSRNHSRNSDQHKVVGALEAHTSMHTQTCTHVPCVLCAVCCVQGGAGHHGWENPIGGPYEQRSIKFG